MFPVFCAASAPLPVLIHVPIPVPVLIPVPIPASVPAPASPKRLLIIMNFIILATLPFPQMEEPSPNRETILP